ncbi:ATP-binding protein [Streptomyces sp. NPDC053726]|uniref:ATP-binding protein n=1 Tax=Streptomyces sp. NPDC053726 TaxID=3365713 RepID=UPI0037D6E783
MELLLDTRNRDAPVRAMSGSVAGQLDMTFDVRAEDLGTVRNIVRAHLRWWRVDSESVHRTLTVVNELLTNVMQHTAADNNRCRMASLLLQKVPDGVTAIVRDQDRCPPAHVTPSPLAEEGRGLMLVRALANDTSMSVTPAGKDVWVFIAGPDVPTHS